MKRAILLTAAALALAGNASAERCERNEKTRGIATMLAQGASDARTLQSKLPKEWACECHEHEIKAYCNVGAPEQGAFLCCIPKGLSCKTKLLVENLGYAWQSWPSPTLCPLGQLCYTLRERN